jgi:tetratricopeptide (TPR) repeat protein
MRSVVQIRYLIITALIFIAVAPATCVSPRKSASVSVEKTDRRIAKRYSDPAINETIWMAWNHYAEKRYEQALLDFERLIAKRYDHFDVLFGAGMSSLEIGDLRKAEDWFSQCLKKNPGHFEAHYFRAETYRRMNDVTRARADLEVLFTDSMQTPLLCGLHVGEFADSDTLHMRRDKAKEILKTL